jgi:hypothetical protein
MSEDNVQIVDVVVENGIISIPENVNTSMFFSGRDQTQKIIDRLRMEASKHIPDTKTKSGRDAIASNAYKVSKSKVVLLKLADGLTEEWKRKTKVVTAEKSFIEKECDTLRDDVRQPLTEWEEAEAERLKAERQAAELLQAHAEALVEHTIFLKVKDIEAREAEIARIEEERRQKEDAEREEQRQKEESARIEKERQEREEAIRKQAEERARLEADAKVKEAECKEAEAKAAALRAETEKKEAAEKAERDRLVAIEAAKEEQARAVREAEEKAKAEAERIERERMANEAADRAEQKRLADEAERKARDVEHRRTINQEALAGLVAVGMTEAKAKDIIKAVAGGLVPHISINY